MLGDETPEQLALRTRLEEWKRSKEEAKSNAIKKARPSRAGPSASLRPRPAVAPVPPKPQLQAGGIPDYRSGMITRRAAAVIGDSDNVLAKGSEGPTVKSPSRLPQRTVAPKPPVRHSAIERPKRVTSAAFGSSVPRAVLLSTADSKRKDEPGRPVAAPVTRPTATRATVVRNAAIAAKAAATAKLAFTAAPIKSRRVPHETRKTTVTLGAAPAAEKSSRSLPAVSAPERKIADARIRQTVRDHATMAATRPMTRTVAVQTCDELLNYLIKARAQPAPDSSAGSSDLSTCEPVKDVIMATCAPPFDADATPKAKVTRHDPHATVYFNSGMERSMEEDPFMSAAQQMHADGPARSPSPPRLSIRDQLSLPHSPSLPAHSSAIQSPMAASRSPSPPRVTPRSISRTAFVPAGGTPRFRPFSQPDTPAARRNMSSPPVVHGHVSAIADNADTVADFLADLNVTGKRVAWHIEEPTSPKGSTEILTPIRASRRDREALGEDVETVVTRVRRSTRIKTPRPSGSDNTAADPTSPSENGSEFLLARHGYAYVPNHHLDLGHMTPSRSGEPSYAAVSEDLETSYE
ncbi:hypothetical protein HDU89_000647 [Geranomyces variabilis]|nr:hypothetical protein HDU89_000647 [Geranomyces variabilis]